jgi:hypothetical protein
LAARQAHDSAPGSQAHKLQCASRRFGVINLVLGGALVAVSSVLATRSAKSFI